MASSWGGLKPQGTSFKKKPQNYSQSSFTPFKGISGGAATSTPVAPASPTAAAPAPGPAPWDTAYEQGKSGLDKDKTAALGQIAKKRVNTSLLYGLNADGTENTTDPYSRLAVLKADYEKIKRGSSASYAARGLGYDGAYQNKINSNAENQGRGLDSLRKGFQQENMSLDDAELGVHSAYNSGLNDLNWRKADSASAKVETGEQDVAGPAPAGEPTRKDKVMAALSTHLTPATRKRLREEAKKNGWIS